MNSQMRYGIGVVPAGEVDVHALAELAHLAEGAGWDGFFIEDYITHWTAPDVPTVDPWIGLAAVALRTERIRLGTLVTPLARRRPWKVAREATTLDHLSKGRFVLGVGLGAASDTMNFDRFGEVTDLRKRAEMLDEALDIIAGLWSGKPFSYHGRHYHVDKVTFRPTPLQQPRIPIWVGGGYPNKGPTARAARWDGSCMYKETHGAGWQDMTAGDVRALKAFVEAQRPEATRYDIVVGGRERAADWDWERAHIRSVAEAGATWWVEFIEPTSLANTREDVMRGPLRID
jgi:alkanesulfonate monooxygenase SsuD/methylene tetrahydromethanopterin reductase-like flavin-dependent oxidoreductase (luciferase family)